MTLQNGVHIRQEAAKQPSSQAANQSGSRALEASLSRETGHGLGLGLSLSLGLSRLADKRMLIGAARLANCGGSGAFRSQAKRAVRLVSIARPSAARLTVMTVKSN